MFEGYFKIPEIPKNNNFTLIRMICCLIVIYEHSIVLSDVDFPILNIRGFAVFVFFILSGFWVTISLLRSVSIKEYASKRCKKILPPYFIVVLFAAIGLFAVSTLSLKEYFTDSGFLKYLAANLSTLNFLHPSLPGVFEGLPLGGAVNGALWTIKVELAFYVCLPIFLLFLNKYHERTKVIMIGLYILSIAYSICCHFLAFTTPAFSPLQNQFPSFMTYFVCGMCFVFYWKKLLKVLHYVVIPAFAILVLCLYFDKWLLTTVFLPVVLTFVVFWFAVKLPVFGRVITKDFSFGMYLVHYPIVMPIPSRDFLIPAGNWHSPVFWD